MCGIIGCISKKAQKVLINGLLKLQYRGYDSAGLAYIENDAIQTRKTLSSPTKLFDLNFAVGIAHTRWATHGEVSLKNAHPHLSYNNKLAIVHNGIIENYSLLKENHLSNLVFKSDTDTEVIVNLIAKLNEEYSLLESIKITTDLLLGSYAFLILDLDGNIYYAVKNMPLIIGKGEGIYIASDVLAFPDDVLEVAYIENNSIGNICNSLLYIPYQNVDINILSAQHMMLKEIKEIPMILTKISKGFDVNNAAVKEKFNKSHVIGLLGCGSSYNACLIGKYLIDKFTDKKVYIFNASEFVFEDINPEIDLYILVSQSGETADILQSYNKISTTPIIAITNVTTSSLAKKCREILNLKCYPEIGVASTKSFIATLFIFFELLSLDNHQEILESIINVINAEQKIKTLAARYKEQTYFIFLGRGIDYLINFENILKIKEVTYSFVDNYLAGELKHGPLALCDENTVVFAIDSGETTHQLFRSNIAEVKARKSEVLVLASARNFQKDDFYRFTTNAHLTIFECAVFFELFAFYLAINRGINPDRPKNLAKSVTVQ